MFQRKPASAPDEGGVGLKKKNALEAFRKERSEAAVGGPRRRSAVRGGISGPRRRSAVVGHVDRGRRSVTDPGVGTPAPPSGSRGGGSNLQPPHESHVEVGLGPGPGPGSFGSCLFFQAGLSIRFLA